MIFNSERNIYRSVKVPEYSLQLYPIQLSGNARNRHRIPTQALISSLWSRRNKEQTANLSLILEEIELSRLVLVQLCECAGAHLSINCFAVFHAKSLQHISSVGLM